FVALLALLLVARPAVAQIEATPAAGAPAPGGNRPRPLGRLEQESVDDAMKTLGQPLIDLAPQGKTIGRVFVVNEDVFSQRDWYFQLFNIFHRTTRSYILERELLLRPGQTYDQALVEETTRNLQVPPPIVINNRPVGQPELSSVIVILPLVSPTPGQVDLLVVTRDVWSLRFNTNFEYQGNALTLLETSLSENNLFGWRKFLSVGFNMDQGRYYYGPTYYDPNIAGTRLTLWTQVNFYTSRETGAYEGNSQVVSLRYPLYSLATPWGAGVDVIHASTVIRGFRGNSVRLVDLEGTPQNDALPYEYRQKVLTVDASAVRQSGRAVIQRATLGYLADRRSAEVLPDFPGDAMQAQLFLAQWTPINEQRSEPYARYEMFTPVYAVLRDLDTFDLRENRQLGPFFRARVSEGLPELGATFRALGLAVTGGFAAAPGGGYGSLSLAASARLRHDDGQWIDQLGTAVLYLASPLVDRMFRIVAGADVASKEADTQHTPFSLGGSNGMRGYAIGEFLGTTAFVGHLEIRTVPLAIFSQRFGALAFYDVGHAAPSFADLQPRNDVGIGLRWLIPQLNSTVIRFDWAVPLQDGTVTHAGMPGRFSAGFLQVFDTRQILGL
ncbi:MAG TPA: BamA/TamA family outer membrane protein, partial [Polyangia bacterium]|nr:BamA/TamA family outer membrane protein [Polyangia bacterium]